MYVMTEKVGSVISAKDNYILEIVSWNKALKDGKNTKRHL